MSQLVNIPEATRKRLVQLTNLLKLHQENKITSKKISELTGWSETSIRHDLWLIGYNKGVSNGYETQNLLQKISEVLGIETSGDISNNSNAAGTDQISVKNSGKNLCIVGLGRLGAALLDENLTGGSSNFHIKAGFDTNIYRVEILRSIYSLYPASEMNFVIKRENIQYAILTVADKDAQTMADRLIKAGIIGIVNMTNVVLKVPDSIKVENISILNALKLVI